LLFFFEKNIILPRINKTIFFRHPMKKPIVKVLSIDGGGIRGIIPCAILSEIERRTDKPISALFDLMAGTSTGGIIASGLSVPHPQDATKPRLSAHILGGMYEEDGPKIFKKRGGVFSGVKQLFEESFDHKGLVDILKNLFGDAELQHALSELLVTSYDIERRKPFYFLSRLAKMRPHEENFRLRDIARSTSAAPTYFEPHVLSWNGREHLALVDGGVFANNPAMLAYTEAMELLRERKKELARKNRAARRAAQLVSADRGLEAFTAPVARTQKRPDVFMLSLGTGMVTKPYLYKDAVDWGLAEWIRPVIEILSQGVSESVDYQMQYVIPAGSDGEKFYMRINPEIPEVNAEMSDVSRKNIEGLKTIAAKAIEENEALIETACRVLTL
jgi:uncharacterized protein